MHLQQGIVKFVMISRQHYTIVIGNAFCCQYNGLQINVVITLKWESGNMGITIAYVRPFFLQQFYNLNGR